MTRIIKTPCLNEEKCMVGQQELSSVIPMNAPLSPEQEAELVLSRARQEAEAIRRQAREEGYREGVETARREQQQRWDQALSDLLNEGQSLLAQREQLLAQAEEELVRLALLIASKVLKREVREDPNYLSSLAQAALEKLIGRSRIKLFLNPLDFSRFQSGALVFPFENVFPMKDPSIGVGGCRIETECGKADATFFHQMGEIACALLDEPGVAEIAVDELRETSDE